MPCRTPRPTGPQLTLETYKIFCHIAAAPISTDDLVKATGLSHRSVGRRLAQLRTMKLVQTDYANHFLTTQGRIFITPND